MKVPSTARSGTIRPEHLGQITAVYPSAQHTPALNLSWGLGMGMLDLVDPFTIYMIMIMI